MTKTGSRISIVWTWVVAAAAEGSSESTVAVNYFVHGRDDKRLRQILRQEPAAPDRRRHPRDRSRIAADPGRPDHRTAARRGACRRRSARLRLHLLAQRPLADRPERRRAAGPPALQPGPRVQARR